MLDGGCDAWENGGALVFSHREILMTTMLWAS
jgi:hypothetical protein